MSNKPVPQQIYRHFKGNLYRIVTLARHSETNEELVVYQALYGDYQVYARPLDMFMERLDRGKYPDAPQEYRFELQQELIQGAAWNRKPEVRQEAEQTRDQIEDQINDQTRNQIESQTEDQTEYHTEDKPEASVTEPEQEQEELNIDPLVLEFLDADSYEERLNILAALHHRITDEMINTMAVSVDLEIEEGDIQERYEELKNCLVTLERFECNRLR